MKKLIIDNPSIKETETISEAVKVEEAVANKETIVAKEAMPIKEAGGSTTVKKAVKKTVFQSSMLKVGAGLATMGAVATMSLTSLINVKLKASIVDDGGLIYQDGALKYQVKVEGLQKSDKLYFNLYDESRYLIGTYSLDFETEDTILKGSIPLDQEELLEKIAASSEVLRYKADLVGEVGLGVERVYDSYAVEISQLVSSFTKVDGYCRCSEDGYYYFTMDYQDDLQLYSNFAAYIVDKEDNKFECEFTNDYHDEQRIYIASALGNKGKLVITYDVKDNSSQKIEIDISI